MREVQGVKVMKSRDSALKQRRFEAEAQRRKVADLETMIGEFEQMAADLDRQVAFEEERTGIKDENHFAYSTFARAAAQRRDNLRTSVAGLREKLTVAIANRDEATAALDAAAINEERSGERQRRNERSSERRVS